MAQAKQQKKQQQPRRRQQRRPIRVARADQIVRTRGRIPKGLPITHHFNAFGPQASQALNFSVGPAVQVSGYRAQAITPTPGNDATLLIFAPGGGTDQLVGWHLSAGTWSAEFSTANIDTTGISTTVSATSPDTVMCSRGSLRLRNVSRAADCGGVVRVLRLSTGFFATTDAQKDALVSLIRGHTRTVTYSGSSLSQCHQWDAIPVSQGKYMEFNKPETGIASYNDPSVSNLLVLIEDFATAQTYEATVAATYYARYSVSGPLANLSFPPPTTTIAHTNYVRDTAEAVGSAGKQVAQAGFAGLTQNLARRAYTAGSGFLESMMNSGVNPGMYGNTSRIMSIEAAEAAPLMLL
jgi:hypothetical protein